MKGLLFIVGLCAWIGGSAGILTPQTVAETIDRVKMLNEINRQLHTAKKALNGAAACPLAQYHNKRWKTADPTDERVARDLITARKFLREAGYSDEELNSPEVREEFLRVVGTECDTTPTCNASSPYRTADGSCNNLANPKWGSTGSPQGRLLASAYFSGTTDPRNTTVNNVELPGPRTISNQIHKPAAGGTVRSATINLQTFQMGQFLDHDITLTPTQTDITACCDEANRLDADNCIPIIFPKDPTETTFFRGPATQENCMNVQRSTPHPCKAAEGSREQINNITSYIDCSNVYGSTPEEQLALRNGPRMIIDNTYWLPKDDHSTGCELDGLSGQSCNLAGDERVNTVPSLAAYHILFALEHNRIVDLLAGEYTNDEELFQEARRIVIASMQKIVYDEFLASFMTSNTMTAYDLLSTASYAYNASVDASISNEFAIAYRFGHTWIPRGMDRFDDSFNRLERIRTRDSFNNMTMTYFGYDDVTNGVITSKTDVGPSQLAYWLTGEMSPESDRFVEEDVRSFLFQDESLGTAFDLVALNIQRGRDHGLKPYTAYMEMCGSDPVTTFAQLVHHSAAMQLLLDTVYDDPNDIDFFTGLLTEGLIEGELGPTLECLLGIQFRALKYGDRFWYQGADAGFTTAQITAINGYTMAKVLCNNFEFDRVDSEAFKRGQRRNCENIADLDIDAFKPSLATKRAKESGHKTLKEILVEKELKAVEGLLERELEERLNEE